MPPKQRTVFEPMTVTISGTTYSAAKLDEFPLKPISKREIGGLGGVQYEYLLSDSSTYWDFTDYLTRLACDVGEIEGDTSYRMIAIYNDLKKMKI